MGKKLSDRFEEKFRTVFLRIRIFLIEILQRLKAHTAFFLRSAIFISGVNSFKFFFSIPVFLSRTAVPYMSARLKDEEEPRDLREGGRKRGRGRGLRHGEGDKDTAAPIIHSQVTETERGYAFLCPSAQKLPRGGGARRAGEGEAQGGERRVVTN